MFQSMTTITLTTIAVTFLIVLWATHHNPLNTLFRFLSALRHDRLLLFHVLAALAVLLLNKLELKLEQVLHWPLDFTPYVYRLEGAFIPFIQHSFESPLVTAVLTFFYIIVFTSLLVSSLFVYFQQRDCHALYTLLYAIMLNYFIAIPFFLFVPVYETWVYHPDVEFLIPHIYPSFEQEYRAMSGLDNCFPSLHTSMSVTLALIAVRSKSRLFGQIASVCAGIIVFSIFYLGIHWFLDAVAGTLLALISVKLARHLTLTSVGSHIKAFWVHDKPPSRL